jgi:hypothetical protein
MMQTKDIEFRPKTEGDMYPLILIPDRGSEVWSLNSSGCAESGRMENGENNPGGTGGTGATDLFSVCNLEFEDQGSSAH